jgi:hypothetical protein
MIASARDHRDPWRFIALARAKHSAKRPSPSTREAARRLGVSDTTMHKA